MERRFPNRLGANANRTAPTHELPFSRVVDSFVENFAKVGSVGVRPKPTWKPALRLPTTPTAVTAVRILHFHDNRAGTLQYLGPEP